MVGISDFDVGSSPSVYLHRNNPDLPNEKCDELTADGIGVLDWGLELSWGLEDVDEGHKGGARMSLANLLSLNRNGGYVVMSSEGYNEVAIGKASPSCLQFEEYDSTSGPKTYKQFSLDTWTSVDTRTEFETLHDEISNRAQLHTLQEVDGIAELVTEAYNELELDGRLDRAR
jgi:hypothetical protein